MEGETTERRCLRCGCLLASDAGPRTYHCSPCRRAVRDYNPAVDPTFDAKLEHLFLTHSATLVEPRPMLGVSADHRQSVESSIRRLRHHLVIIGVRLPGGYCCVGVKSAPPRKPGRPPKPH